MDADKYEISADGLTLYGKTLRVYDDVEINDSEVKTLLHTSQYEPHRLLPVPPKFASTGDADAWMEKNGGAVVPPDGKFSIQWSGTGVFKIDI